MEGHFGLGNTNTLATIDVAGAFMVLVLLQSVQLYHYFMCSL